MMTPAAKTKQHETPKQPAPATTPTAEPTPAPAPAAEAVAAAAVAVQPTPTKQQKTLEDLKAAWTARKVDLSKMTVTPDGKFLLVKPAEAWPTIKIGPSGGGDIVEVKSFPKFFEAAVIADELLAKQVARTAPKPVVVTVKANVVAGQPDQTKADAPTPAAKKRAADAQLEKQLEQRA